MPGTVSSKNGVPIRLTAERWSHITEEHCELAGMREGVLEAVSDPSFVLAGNHGELIAVREVGEGKFLVAVYRELADDGFVITAFLTHRGSAFSRRERVWPA